MSRLGIEACALGWTLALVACSGGQPGGATGAGGGPGLGGAPSTGAAGAGGAAGATTGAGGGSGVAGSGVAGAGGSTSGAAGAGGASSTAGATGDAALPPSDGGNAEAGLYGPPALDPGTMGDGDVMIGPTYANAPELTVGPGVPLGALKMFAMKSSDSKIYPGLNGAYTRDVWVYIPAQYKTGTPAPFIVAQDGDNYILRLPEILDNMIATRRLPTMIAIMINSGGGDGVGSERGLEYDTVSDKWVTFVETEVLPVVRSMYGVTLTTDPNGRATMGGSSGGAAAFTMGWFRPDLYRLILTYSGTYVNQESPVDPMFPDGAWEYHEHLIPENPMKPLRVWLECGEDDYNANDPPSTLHNFRLANQDMAAVLQAKGYHNRFEYALGAQHNDARVVQQTLPEALEWLWRGYPIP
jgi:iron(III)-enterobactin esterase